MQKAYTVLLVSDDDEILRALRQAMEQLGIESNIASTCVAARIALERKRSPELVFTDVILSDGSWMDVIRLAAKAEPPLPVIVCARTVDYKLYVAVKRGGAADLLLPPISVAAVSAAVRHILGAQSVVD